MAWNLPSAWSAGEVSTAAKLNQLRESLDWVHTKLNLDVDAAYHAAVVRNNGGTYFGTTDGIVGSAVLAIPTGTVTRGVVISFIVTDLTGVLNSAHTHYAKPGASYTDYALYSTELYLRIHAGGAVEFIRTSGTKTFRVTWMMHVH